MTALPLIAFDVNETLLDLTQMEPTSSVKKRAHSAAQATDQRQGFMKALVGNRNEHILGFTMIGTALQYSINPLGLLFSNVPPRPGEKQR